MDLPLIDVSGLTREQLVDHLTGRSPLCLYCTTPLADHTPAEQRSCAEELYGA